MGSRLRLSVALLALIFALVGCQEPEPDTQAFTSEEGGFRVDFPEEPDRRSQNVGSADSRIELVAFTSADEDGLVSSVAYADYPEDAVTDPNAFLDSAADGAASSYGGSITSRKPTIFKEFAALDYVIEGSESQLRGRLVLAGSRLYILQQVRQDDPVEARGFDNFVNTFSLL